MKNSSFFELRDVYFFVIKMCIHFWDISTCSSLSSVTEHWVI